MIVVAVVGQEDPLEIEHENYRRAKYSKVIDLFCSSIYATTINQLVPKPSCNVGGGDIITDILHTGLGQVQHGAGQAGGD